MAVLRGLCLLKRGSFLPPLTCRNFFAVIIHWGVGKVCVNCTWQRGSTHYPPVNYEYLSAEVCKWYSTQSTSGRDRTWILAIRKPLCWSKMFTYCTVVFLMCFFKGLSKVGCPNFAFKKVSLQSETYRNRNSFASFRFVSFASFCYKSVSLP